MLAGAAVLACAGAAGAQNPTPRDTAQVRVPPEQLPVDTFVNRARTDSVPADSITPAPNLPEITRPADPGWWNATFVWNRDELLRVNLVSLLELLERVPGLLATRTGGFGRPAGLAAFGRGGGRIRVFRDGYELQPLASADLDLQEIPLAALSQVRVERRLLETRVELSSFRLPDRRAFSEIEAATGDPDARFLRGLFSRPLGASTTLLFAFDVADTEGFGANQDFGVNTLWARVGRLITPNAGVEVEYRQTGTDRAGLPFRESATRSELLLRGRARLSPSLVVEGWAGQVARAAEPGDSIGQDLQATQLGARGALRLGTAGLDAMLRGSVGNGGVAAPSWDLTVRGDARLAGRLGAAAEFRTAALDGTLGTEVGGALRLPLARGFAAFGEVAVGSRPVALVADTLVGVVDVAVRPRDLRLRVDTTLVPTATAEFRALSAASTGFRAGGEWQGRRGIVGVAWLATSEGRSVPFGPAFDTVAAPTDVRAASAAEGYASLRFALLPVPWLRSARLDVGYTRWLADGGRPLLPEDAGRLAVEFQESFRGGNFEPTLRLDLARRGPSAAGDGLTVPAYLRLDAFLQIRILDVRIFGIAGNLLADRDAADVAGFRLPPIPYFLYGLRWFFRN